MNGHNFIKGANAPDGIHETVESNEYRNAKWWTEKALRKDVMDKLAALAIVAGAIAAFCIVGMMEM